MLVGLLAQLQPSLSGADGAGAEAAAPVPERRVHFQDVDMASAGAPPDRGTHAWRRGTREYNDS